MLAAGVLSMPVEAPQGHRCILAAPVLPLMAARALRALKRGGVTLFEDACSEITASHVVLARGMRLACDAPMLAIGASAPIWLAWLVIRMSSPVH